MVDWQHYKQRMNGRLTTLQTENEWKTDNITNREWMVDWQHCKQRMNGRLTTLQTENEW